MDTFYFCLEFLKEASSDYYKRNKSAILAKQRQYRQANAAVLSRKAKAYRRKVRSGSIRQRSRQRVGNSYVYTGVR